MESEKTYKFTPLLSGNKDGSIEGAMSPVLVIKELAKYYKFKIHGLCRLENDSSNTYDHLITKTEYRNDIVYRLFVDMGAEVIPVAIWIKEDNDLTITPIYLKETTEEAMKQHAFNVEDPNSKPIMVMNETELKDMFAQVDKSNAFEIQKYEDTLI